MHHLPCCVLVRYVDWMTFGQGQLIVNQFQSHSNDPDTSDADSLSANIQANVHYRAETKKYI